MFLLEIWTTDLWVFLHGDLEFETWICLVINNYIKVNSSRIIIIGKLFALQQLWLEHLFGFCTICSLWRLEPQPCEFLSMANWNLRPGCTWLYVLTSKSTHQVWTSIWVLYCLLCMKAWIPDLEVFLNVYLNLAPVHCVPCFNHDSVKFNSSAITVIGKF